ncbi:TraX family protein [Luteimonas sp. 22616]|uniref:TraX family protein n=1 Tax=Luteimonas sp. 22616 TaxID=3453951 RepID=UPI003F83ADCA
MNAQAQAAPLRLTYDNAEALKWLAFAAMLVDHANKVFADGAWAWAVPVGRVAFPVFAFLIGRHLLSERLLVRLLAVGAVAAVPYMLALTPGSPLPLNILFSFAFAAGVARLWTDGRRNYAGVLFVLAVMVCDYTLPGMLLILSCWAWWQERTRATWAMLASSLLMVCLLNGNLFALLAVPMVLLAAACDWRVPRVRHFFWIAYPVHLVVLAALAFAFRV